MSAIPAVLQRDPLALLSFLDLKTGGRRPGQVAEFVQPTMDLTDWYAASQLQVATGTIAAFATGFLTGISPPQGKLWLVRRAWAISPVSAVNFCSFSMAYQPNTVLGGNGVVLSEPARSTRGGVIGANSEDVAAVWSGAIWIRDEGAIGVVGYAGSAGVPNPITVGCEFLELTP